MIEVDVPPSQGEGTPVSLVNFRIFLVCITGRNTKDRQKPSCRGANAEFKVALVVGSDVDHHLRRRTNVA